MLKESGSAGVGVMNKLITAVVALAMVFTLDFLVTCAILTKDILACMAIAVVLLAIQLTGAAIMAKV